MTAIRRAPEDDCDTRADTATSIRIRVSHEAAPLIEFILDEADLQWRDLVRERADAIVIVDTTNERLEATIRTLRQRLGGNLAELS